MGTRLRVAFAVVVVLGAALAGLFGAPAGGFSRASAAVALAERPVAVRFANLTDDRGVIDLLVDGRARVVAMVGGRTTDFIVLPPGRHTVGIRRAGMDVPMADPELVLPPGSSPTVLLIGDSSNPSMFTLPDVADSAPSIRVINASQQSVRVDIAGVVVDVDSAGSYLAPVKAGVVEVEAAITDIGDASSGRADVRVGRTSSMTAIVTGTSSGLAVHAIAPHPLTPATLALLVEEGGPSEIGPADARSGTGGNDIWVRRVLAGLVVVLVFAATLSSLAVFRVESLDDRVRHRMR